MVSSDPDSAGRCLVRSRASLVMAELMRLTLVLLLRGGAAGQRASGGITARPAGFEIPAPHITG
jgi:hypothetical protein